MKRIAYDSAERALVTAIGNMAAMHPEDALIFVESSRLVAEDFANVAYADVFRAQLDFLRRNIPVELFAIEAALAGSAAVKAKGGRAFLAPLLLDHEFLGHSAPEHARLVRDASFRRRAIGMLAPVLDRLGKSTESSTAAVGDGLQALGDLVNVTPSLGTAEQDIFALGEQMDAAQQGRRELVIPTGIIELDKAIGGLQPAHLTLVGALPGVGKSALLATILRNVANTGRRVGFFSLEDERGWLTRRFLSLESSVPVFLLATRPLTSAQRALVDAAAPRVYDTLKSIVIDDRLALTPAEVAATAREMVLQHGCKAIMVDHLGEMRFSRSERYDLDISDALVVLRDVAKRHHIPVLVASHVKRKQGADISTPPSLTDFANSSAPERMARVALGLSKPHAGCLRVNVVKQTNGQSGQEIDLAMVPHAAMVDSSRFANASEAAQ